MKGKEKATDNWIEGKRIRKRKTTEKMGWYTLVKTMVTLGENRWESYGRLLTPGKGHGPFFQRIDQGRFFDCCRKFHSDETQTFFRKGQVHTFQDDHLFTSEDLAEKVMSCYAVNNKTTREVSDHIPLIAEIDIPLY